MESTESWRETHIAERDNLRDVPSVDLCPIHQQHMVRKLCTERQVFDSALRSWVFSERDFYSLVLEPKIGNETGNNTYTASLYIVVSIIGILHMCSYIV